jgi:hypothetical protein
MLAHALHERFGIASTVDNLAIKLDRPLNQEVFDNLNPAHSEVGNLIAVLDWQGFRQLPGVSG